MQYTESSRMPLILTDATLTSCSCFLQVSLRGYVENSVVCQSRLTTTFLGSIYKVDKFVGSCNTLISPGNNVYDNSFNEVGYVVWKGAGSACYFKHSTMHSVLLTASFQRQQYENERGRNIFPTLTVTPMFFCCCLSYRKLEW